MPRGCLAFQWIMGLDMARGGPETDGVFVKVAVDANVTKFPALETGLMVTGVVTSEGYVMVTAGPPDFSVSEGDFFFFG